MGRMFAICNGVCDEAIKQEHSAQSLPSLYESGTRREGRRKREKERGEREEERERGKRGSVAYGRVIVHVSM